MEKKAAITLSLDMWNIVIHALAQRPFFEVVDLINEIKKQGDEAVKQNVDENNA